MKHHAAYSVVSLHPYPNRSEHVNIGVAVWVEAEPFPRLHLLDNLKKVVSFYPKADIAKLRTWERDLPDLLSVFGLLDKDSQLQFLHNFGTLSASLEQGFFSFSDQDDYVKHVHLALDAVAQPAEKRTIARESVSRLFVDLKLQFSLHGWMGKQASDINNHLIVPRYTLPTEEQLVAEFALKNGAFHVIETLDIRSGINANKRMEAQGKSFLMHVAKSLEQADRSRTSTYTILAGANQDTKSKQIYAIVNRYSDNVIEWEDTHAVESFMTLMAKATNTPMLTVSVD